jgi:maltose O-acetyltransferase
LSLFPAADLTAGRGSRREWPAKQLRWHVIGVARWLWRDKLAASPLIPGQLRRVILRAGGLDVRTNSMSDHCYIGTKDLRIGRETFLNRGCFFEGAGRIEIGEDCLLGPEVMILTSNHALDDGGSISAVADYKPVVIGDRCWIGARATILPGVTIGDGAVIAAGAVVNADCAADSIYGGVPARLIRPTRREP